ncbi:hypothetical protein Dimus_008511 [Dionaea muscipula]
MCWLTKSISSLSATNNGASEEFKEWQVTVLSCLKYNAVMERWQISFNWEQQGDEAVQIRDVRTRVLTDMAWVE